MASDFVSLLIVAAVAVMAPLIAELPLRRRLPAVAIEIGLFLLVRGLPALPYRNDLPRRDLAPLALLSATGLPLIVAIAEIGVSIGRMRTDNAAALVGAGMVSVFLFPLAALFLRGERGRPKVAPITDPPPTPAVRSSDPLAAG